MSDSVTPNIGLESFLYLQGWRVGVTTPVKRNVK